VAVAQDRDREIRRLAASLKSKLTIEDIEILSYILNDLAEAFTRMRNALSKLGYDARGGAGGYGYADRDIITLIVRSVMEEYRRRSGAVEEEAEAVEVPEEKVREIELKLKSAREKQ